MRRRARWTLVLAAACAVGVAALWAPVSGLGAVRGAALYATNGGQVLRSGDAGATWAILHAFPGAAVTSLSFPARHRGWAVLSPAIGTPSALCPGAPPVAALSP